MQRQPGIILSVAIAAMVAAIAGVALLILTVWSQTSATESQAQRAVSAQAARAMQLSASTLVEREWTSMSGVAARTDPSDYVSARSFVDAVVRASNAVAWAGIADLQGNLVAASNGLREGRDVSREAWYVSGLQEGHMSGATTPWANAAPDDRGDVVRMSRPIRNSFGVPRGVIVYSLRVDWLRAFLDEASARLGAGYEVRDQNGETVFQGEATQAQLYVGEPQLPNIGGFVQTRLVEPSEGDPYMMTVLPDFISGEMPELGWDLVVRVPAYTSASSLIEAARQMVWVALGLVAAIAGCAALFAGVFLRPIVRLSREAEAISQGAAVYPSEQASSAEASRLSNALLRIQTRLGSDRTEPPATEGEARAPAPLRLVPARKRG